nr:MAG TPA: hypothetical protein [Caudoviricetes sp.]
MILMRCRSCARPSTKSLYFLSIGFHFIWRP